MRTDNLSSAQLSPGWLKRNVQIEVGLEYLRSKDDSC